LTSWKDVPRGKNPPAVVNVVIETPLGSRIKYAATEEHGAMVVSKLLASTFAYPANAGFFAQCWGEDGDPLDAMVLGGAAMAPGTVCSARPVAVFRMTDRGRRDDKVVCVLDADPDWAGTKTLSDLPRHVREVFDTFHRTYRRQEGTQDLVKLEGWQGVTAAHKLIVRGHRRFDERQISESK
jgi:inorganic pyrophosphatase